MPDLAESCITEAERWVDAQPVEKLRDLVLNHKWVMGHAGDELELKQMPEDELKQMMKDELAEDYAYVVPVLRRIKVKVKYEK